MVTRPCPACITQVRRTVDETTHMTVLLTNGRNRAARRQRRRTARGGLGRQAGHDEPKRNKKRQIHEQVIQNVKNIKKTLELINKH